MNNINYDELDVLELEVLEEDLNIRIDKFLSSKLTDFSRSYLQDLIK